MTDTRQYLWSPPVLRFEALGVPIGQGRIRHLGKGRPAVHANAARLNPWRDVVRAAAQAAIAAHPTPGVFPLSRAVAFELIFTMPYPKTRSSQRPYPTVTSAGNPDVDHLERAVHDAMKEVVIVDDALVVDARHPKTYPAGVCPTAHPRAGVQPGVQVTVHVILPREEP